MARKEKKITTKQKKSVKRLKVSRASFLRTKKELLSSPQSYRSLFLGVATVIILFLVGFGITRLFLAGPTPEISNEAVTTQNIGEALKKSEYVVKEGDTLWSISEEKYGSGFEWYRIADENKITDVRNLETGIVIDLPEINVFETVKKTEEDKVLETVKKNENVIDLKITGDSYVIKRGDNLWDIAVRAYGDGYRWVDIANANNLVNPDIIHADNKLLLPR